MIEQEKTSSPNYLYKIISEEGWLASQGQLHLVLTEFDTDFIHLATQSQLTRVIQKFWSKAGPFYVLKLVPDELEGKLILETNPGGSTAFYHLYNGAVPLTSIKGYAFYTSAEAFTN